MGLSLSPPTPLVFGSILTERDGNKWISNVNVWYSTRVGSHVNVNCSIKLVIFGLRSCSRCGCVFLEKHLRGNTEYDPYFSFTWWWRGEGLIVHGSGGGGHLVNNPWFGVGGGGTNSPLFGGAIGSGQKWTVPAFSQWTESLTWVKKKVLPSWKLLFINILKINVTVVFVCIVSLEER